MPTPPTEEAPTDAADAVAAGGGGTLEDRRAALPEPPKTMKSHVDYFFSREDEQGRVLYELKNEIQQLNIFLRNSQLRGEKEKEEFSKSVDEKLGNFRDDMDHHKQSQEDSEFAYF